MVDDKINPWLEEALRRAEARRKTPRGLRLIVQVEPERQEEVKARLRSLRGVVVLDQLPGFIRVDVEEPALIDRIAAIPGVVMVSYEKPVWPMAYGLDTLFKTIAVQRDPLLNKLAPSDLEALGIEVKPTAILPKPMEALLTPRLPMSPLPPVLVRGGVEWRLVTDTRRIIEAPSDYRIRRVKVAVIDTGANPHPAFRKVFRQVVLVPEPPMDTMGHGEWVSTCAFGDPAPSRYGWFVPVASAPGDKFMHVKIFTAFGPTSSWHVMKAMEIAARWGARVVNMSLGGPLEGRVDQDPECVMVKRLHERYGTIFVIAAGNDGPGEWTIASPGASPYALTVGALDWKTMRVSSYSSRGPQGRWYRNHRSEFEEDYARYGDLLLKPDILAPGGDVKSQIVSGVTGWYDGFYDFMVDGWEMMIGTSMATPHAAGLVALALDKGVIGGLGQLKERLRATAAGKNSDGGWGLVRWSRLLQR